jgi:hypothetical protein
MFYSDVTANRPAAGILGRIFIATDSPYGIYRDTGSSWVQIAGSSTGAVTGSGVSTRVAFWDSTSSISSNSNLFWDNVNNRLGIGTSTAGAPLDIHGTGTIAHFNGTGTNNSYLFFQNAGVSKWRIGNTYSAGANYYAVYDFLNSIERLKITNDGQLTSTTNITASGSSTGYQGIYNSNTINIPASTTFPSGGYTYAGMNDYYFQIFAGSATFQSNNTNSAYFGINRIDFSGTGTITMTQASGVRAMAAAIFQNQYNGTSSGTITHLAGAQILGNYRSAGSGTLSVTNGYGLIINNLDDYGAGFSFTNRYAIYQAGTLDDNYFAGKLINTIKYNRQTASYVLSLSDRSKMIEMNVATANTLTIPPSGTTNFDIGTEIEVVQYGAGATTITAGVGVTIRSLSGYLKLTGQYVCVSLVKVGADEWYCFGNTSA